MRVADSINSTIIDARYKGFASTGTRIDEVGQRQWNVARGDLALPLLTLRREDVQHNVGLMSDWCREHGALLCPHAKTTMAPQLVQLQLDAGAWGVTAATMSQMRTFASWGIRRVLLANQISQPTEAAWLAGLLNSDEQFEPIGYVDSVAGVGLLDSGLRAAGARRGLPVLVELGVADGRSGARDLSEAQKIVEAVNESSWLKFAGVSGYEGIIGGTRSPSNLGEVDDFLSNLREFAESVATPDMIISAGGSAYFDRVVEILGSNWTEPIRLVLRSGCYITHDHGMYERLSPLAGALRPALALWASVTSRPQSDLALAGFGKRDVSFDVDLPVALEVLSADGRRRAASGITVAGLNDQHAYLRLDPAVDLSVGDRIIFGISHPCTAFDKWRLIPMIDTDDNVVDAIATFF